MAEKPYAKKRFGQHFLTDDAIIASIVSRIGARDEMPIVEIGPGRGALTTPLLAKGCEVIAVEFDRDMIAVLQSEHGDNPRFTLLQQDILSTDIAAICGGRKAEVIGNLPYNISSPILFHLMRQLNTISSMYFMLQKEVVNRICAEPGSRDYGRPSVMIQRLCHAEQDLFIPPDAFSPPPKVDSAMLRLAPLNNPRGGDVDSAWFEKVVAAAFSQRRKTLRNTLNPLLDAGGIERAGVDPGLRAERVSVEQFAALTREAIRVSTSS